MKKSIALVSSSVEYSQTCLPVWRQLEKRGYRTYWISFCGFEYAMLRRNGVPADRILDTFGRFKGRRLEPEAVHRQLAILEDSGAPFANDIILMDRLLCRKGQEFAYGYLAHITEEVMQFLTEGEIELVIGGRDTALQVACTKICRRLELPYVVPTLIRLPEGRYGFCEGHTEESFVKLRECTQQDRAAASAYLRAFREKEASSTLRAVHKKNNQFVRRIPQDILLAFRNVRNGFSDRGNDFTRNSLARLFGMYFRRRFSALYCRVARAFEGPGDKPFVIYAYHVQPESSVDVLAPYYDNQPNVIRQLARSLPTSHELYVRPHPDYAGGISPKQIAAIKRIPGVRIVSPSVSGRYLMQRASAVVTLTGTIAYEAALQGIPSIIFGNEYFRRVPGVHHCRSVTELPQLFKEVLDVRFSDVDEKIVEFLAYHHANSFAGTIDGFVAPMTSADVDALAGAYEAVYEALVPRKSARVLSGVAL